MKYYKRLKLYKASNVTFNPETKLAKSYNWWNFTQLIGNKLVFNNYNYSSTTCKHQSKVRSLLNSLGIKIDYFVESPKGLQNIGSAIEHYYTRIMKLRDAIAVKGSHKAKNQERLATITRYKKQIELVKKLQNKMSQEVLNESN